MPSLVPLVVLRGSGERTRHLADIAARRGVRTLQHAEGGGLLVVHASADVDTAVALIRSSLAPRRLQPPELAPGRPRCAGEAPASSPRSLERAWRRRLSAPHNHPLAHEWALDYQRNASVTVLPVDAVDDALAFAHQHTSGLAGTIVSEDDEAARRFLDA